MRTPDFIIRAVKSEHSSVIITIPLLLLGFALLYLVPYEITDDNKLFLFALFVSAPPFIQFIRLYKRTHVYWMTNPGYGELARPLIGPFFSMWILSFALLTVVNCELDWNPSYPRPMRVVSKPLETCNGEGSNSAELPYCVEATLWKDPRRKKTIVVTKEQYDRIVPGRTRLVFQVKPGLLGCEWITSRKYEIEDALPTPESSESRIVRDGR